MKAHISWVRSHKELEEISKNLDEELEEFFGAFNRELIVLVDREIF